MRSPYTVIDLHCDLLSYLHYAPAPDIFTQSEIGCSLPFLRAGNVGLQVLAIFAPTATGSAAVGLAQSKKFTAICNAHKDYIVPITSKNAYERLGQITETGVVTAIENASSFCEESGSLLQGLQQLDKMIAETGKVLYIGLTHHAENRFGGGNYASAGLKKDGEVLLEYISGQQIAIDFSHTSDALAYGILNHIEKKNLSIPLLASHSNYRAIWDHVRNLPNELAAELIHRNGLIGLNLLRAFMHTEEPDVLLEHVAHGLALGGENNICFGVDYFYTEQHPDRSRVPFYFEKHQDARCYKTLIDQFKQRFSEEIATKIAHQNASRFIADLYN